MIDDELAIDGLAVEYDSTLSHNQVENAKCASCFGRVKAMLSFRNLARALADKRLSGEFRSGYNVL